MNIEGKIVISRVTSNRDDDTIKIELHDENTGICFVRGTMSLADFAMAITGLGYMPIQLELNGLEYVGKKLVQMGVDLFVPKGIIYNQEKLYTYIVGEIESLYPEWILRLSITSRIPVDQNHGVPTVRVLLYKYE